MSGMNDRPEQTTAAARNNPDAWSHVAAQIHSDRSAHWRPTSAQAQAGNAAALEAIKIEGLILSGNATQLQQEMVAHRNDPESLRPAMAIVHDDLARQHIDVQYRPRPHDPQLFVQSDSGKTVLSFGSILSITGKPLIGTREGNARQFNEPNPEDPNHALHRVLTEAAGSSLTPAADQTPAPHSVPSFEQMRREWSDATRNIQQQLHRTDVQAKGW